MQLDFELLGEKMQKRGAIANEELTPGSRTATDLEQTSRLGFEQAVTLHLQESADIKRQIASACMDSILDAAELIAEAFRTGGKLMLCGNGGSAADCQHLAAEFVNWLSKDFQRPGLPAIALTTDTSFLTAFANDSSFESVFERQLQTLGKPGDVLIGISTSGSSPNVVLAIAAAKKMGIAAIALTGTGGKLAAIADVTIAVPSTNTAYIQEGHLAVEHILCSLVESHLFSERGATA
ncbi:D-sedoheptulose 7-phosphate isomerase [Microcoleus sp. Z1_A1]|uniref:D-sedoheptulose 7-phosphate isomerase n=1 Tax=Microcoleus sp. Z1_A1 TaxID=3055428 RepID=UPI002FD3CA81